jgi:TonB family protein
MQPSNDFFTPRAAPPPPAERVPNDARHGGVNLALGKIERFDRAPAARNQNDLDADIQVTGAQVGQDWMRQLHGWWIDHRRYPSEAAANYEDGDVTIRFDVAKNGMTSQAELIHSSNSRWLDAAAVGTFSRVHLPPLPPTTPEDHATITITIRYILY